MYKHILIPVAPGHADEYAHVLEAARKLLDDGGTISALAVLEDVPSYVKAHLPPETYNAGFDDLKAEIEAALRDTGVSVHIKRGQPGHTILDFVKAQGVDCVTISSHRPGPGDFFIGSTAARVVRHAQCSVLVMR